MKLEKVGTMTDSMDEASFIHGKLEIPVKVYIYCGYLKP
jgi:hypothetical protein